ncbi:MAG: DNRLRE domain-containing protein, partial [Bacteroidia bacterium]|nr:DNRLRE domain-containing protein [Bacteroidia bacterium]
MGKKALLFCALANLTLQVLFAQQTQELKVYDDTYIYRSTSGTGDEIRGLESFLYTYHSTAGSQYRREVFLRFDLSGLSPYLETVKLRLYADLKEAHTLNLYPVSKTTWVEDDINANNKVDKAGADITTVYTTAATDLQGLGAKYYEWDVASIVKDSINAGAPFIAFRMRDRDVVKTAAGAGVIVNWHAKENASGFYPHLQYVEKDVSTLRLQNLMLNGSIIEGFASNKYKYTVTLPWNATVIPTVTASPLENSSTLAITAAVNLTGSESERTTKISVTNTAGSLTYSVVFQLSAQPNNADLLSISADGKPIVPFDKTTTNYTLNVPH